MSDSETLTPEVEYRKAKDWEVFTTHGMVIVPKCEGWTVRAGVLIFYSNVRVGGQAECVKQFSMHNVVSWNEY